MQKTMNHGPLPQPVSGQTPRVAVFPLTSESVRFVETHEQFEKDVPCKNETKYLRTNLHF